MTWTLNTQRKLLLPLGVMVAAILLISGCAPSINPAAVVENYYKALVEKDREQFLTLVCAEWELDATLEFDSFGAVETDLQDVSCEQAGTEGDNTLVRCTGAISVTYQGEDNRLFSLGDNTYTVKSVDGEWRMCGYTQGG